jgi:nitrite reductase/ring-hydroxylating ferredoxin subunit
MTIQCIEDVKGDPEIGQSYILRAIKFTDAAVREQERLKKSAAPQLWWPILGPQHTDPDLGAPREHFHLDFRFVPMSGVRWLVINTFNEDIVLNQDLNRVSSSIFLTRSMEDIEDRAFVCYRAAIRFPLDAFSQGSGVLKLPAKYEHKKLCLKNRICPHRQVNLNSVTPDSDGVIHCPGHGLKFSAKTGAVLMPNLQ